MLLAPAASSLAYLGETLKIPKVDLPPGYSKDRMDLFKRDCLAEYLRYALTDTLIALHWADRVFGLIEAEFGISKMQPTLGSCGVRMIEQAFAKVSVDLDCFCGSFGARGGKRNPLNEVASLWSFSANCYHGGLNVPFWVGHSPSGRAVYDHDIRGAYTTAMALLRVPDWNTVRQTTDINEIAVIDEGMSWCRVRFEFPVGTRFPCLPVRGGDRGLIFPLSGIAWCCGPEIVVARGMGAILAIEEGYRVDWQVGHVMRPFERFAIDINRIRDQAKAAGDAVLNLLAKEVGNSVYGKVAQAVDTFRTVSDAGMAGSRGKRVFDSREESMTTLPPSRITSPMHAAKITSLVRALLSEALSRVPADEIVFTATTDGFLTTLSLSDIDCSGPVAKAFADARSRLTGDAGIWEQKHAVAGVVVVKTRCTYSRPPIDPTTAGGPVLARGGYRSEQAFSTPWEECAFWIDFHHNRDYHSEITSRHLIPLRTQWIEDADLVSLVRTTRVNLDFDWKRRIGDATDIGGIISGDTKPWETIDQFHAERDELERWKKSERRVERTVADLEDRRRWALARSGQRMSGSTRQSGRPPLVNAVMRAIARHRLGAPRRSYQQWASLFTQLGFSASPQTFKDAARRGKMKVGKLTDLTAIEHSFAEGLVGACASIDILQLAEPGSNAWRLLKEVCEKAPEEAPQAEDLADPTAAPVEQVVVAGSLPPYSKAPPSAGPDLEMTKSRDSAYEGGALREGAFKDIQHTAITITPGSMSLNATSVKAPPNQETVPTTVCETLPAASLTVVCRAARATKVVPWSVAQRLQKYMPRMTAPERTALIVELMDKMVAAVGTDAMELAMRASR